MALLMAVGVGAANAVAATPVPTKVMFCVSRSSINTTTHCPCRLSFSRTETLVGAAAATLSAHFTASLSLSTTLPSGKNIIYCGRGDRKTAKGKRFNHSFGNARPHNKKKGRGPPRLSAPPAPPRKDKFDDGEVVKIEIDPSLFN